MKKVFFLLTVVASMFVWSSCSDANARYLDLQTGEKVKLEKDPQTGLLVDTETKKPVYIYVDTKTHDTIYGNTGAIINGHVILNSEKKYVYENDIETPAMQGDIKVKTENDGDIKIKTDDKKTKKDGETGEKKVKKD